MQGVRYATLLDEALLMHLSSGRGSIVRAAFVLVTILVSACASTASSAEATTAFEPKFWENVDFWIGTVIGLMGVFFSVKAFMEARQAKRAANEAGRTVKLQTITIELTEVSQKLDRLRTDIQFNEARDLLSEISRRLRRATSPFTRDNDLMEAITALRNALDEAEAALDDVRPNDPAQGIQAPQAVYFAVQRHFATINNCVADVVGLFERKSQDFGGDDGKS
jgi:hypothetical protein